MTFAPDAMKNPAKAEQQLKPAEKKELSQEEKAEQLQRKKEMIQTEFDEAQEQLDEVEAMLASPDLDPARKAELQAEMDMIQSTMDSMEGELAGLNQPEEAVMPVDNTAAEVGEEPAEVVAEAPAEAVTQEKERASESLRENLDRVNKIVKEAGKLEAMGDSILDKLVTEKSPENFQILNEVIRGLSEAQLLLMEEATAFLERATKEDPKVADRLRSQIYDRVTGMIGKINALRNGGRLAVKPGEKLQETKELSEVGLAGEKQILSLYKLVETSVNANNDFRSFSPDERNAQVIKSFLANFETTYHGGAEMFSNTDEGGVAALRSLAAGISRNKELGEEVKALLKVADTCESMMKLRKQKVDRSGNW